MSRTELNRPGVEEKSYSEKAKQGWREVWKHRTVFPVNIPVNRDVDEE